MYLVCIIIIVQFEGKFPYYKIRDTIQYLEKSKVYSIISDERNTIETVTEKSQNCLTSFTDYSNSTCLQLLYFLLHASYNDVKPYI